MAACTHARPGKRSIRFSRIGSNPQKASAVGQGVLPTFCSFLRRFTAVFFEIENDNDDKIEWLIIGGFIIGNTLGIVLDNFMLGYVFAMIGLGLGFVLKVLKK